MGVVESEGPPTPTGTDFDEYNQWLAAQGGTGLGEIIYDDVDDARDATEWAELSGTTQSSPD